MSTSSDMESFENYDGAVAVDTSSVAKIASYCSGDPEHMLFLPQPVRNLKAGADENRITIT